MRTRRAYALRMRSYPVYINLKCLNSIIFLMEKDLMKFKLRNSALKQKLPYHLTTLFIKYFFILIQIYAYIKKKNMRTYRVY